MSSRNLNSPLALTLVVGLGLSLSLPACTYDSSGRTDTVEGGAEGVETSGSGMGTEAGTEAGMEAGTESDTETETETETDTDTETPQPSGFGQTIGGGATASGFNTIPLTIGGAAYNVKTNPWGGADQTITAGIGSVFTIDAITHPGGAEPWEVASFPAVYKGTAFAGESTADSGLPIAIEDIAAVFTGMQSNALSSNYQGNTTYDVYFTANENYTGGPPDVYLMVWFDAEGLNPINGPGEGWTCAGDPPTFVEACSAAGQANIEGKTFHRFVGPNGNATVISYVPDTRMGVWEFDLNSFIQDAVSEGILTPQMYLQSVQAGFELADGGTGLTIEDFYIDVF